MNEAVFGVSVLALDYNTSSLLKDETSHTEGVSGQ